MIAVTVTLACTAPKASDQGRNWFDAEALISTSDRVMVALFVEERTVTVDESDPQTGGVAGQSVVLFRQFEVVDSYKGTSKTADLIWVAFDPRGENALADGSGAEHQFTIGQRYALFLKGRLRPILYPIEYGPVLWSGNGMPSVALVDGDALVFLADVGYLKLLGSREVTLPAQNSAAPFTLDIDTMADLAG